MPRIFVLTLQAICFTLALAAVSPALAGTKSPLLGKTREQVVTQLGEPKSNIRVGAREMLFFAKVKLTLRNDVVIEMEDLPEEAPAAPVPPAPTKRTAETTTAPEPPANPAPAQPSPAANQTTALPAADTTSAGPSAKAAEGSPKPAKPPEPGLSIKFIKSGSAGAKAAAQTAVVPAAAPTPVAAKAAASAVAPGSASESKQPAVATPAAAESKPLADLVPAKAAAPKVEEPAEVAAEPEASATEQPNAKPQVDQRKKKASIMAKLRNRWRVRRDIETEDNSVQLFTGRSYMLAAIVIVGGLAFMWWRYGQRRLALEASAVSRSPFTPAAAVDPSAMFTSELIGKLGQKKFERLVASYYMKTGVVAERTNTDPTAPMHIKIFWKGEQKPFAGVQCHANPPTLIQAKPLEGLFEALTAADIRRGYVVTTGKFSVEARDFAAEKVFTLLTGDLFVEKLNALPPAARTELLTETNTVEPAAPA